MIHLVFTVYGVASAQARAGRHHFLVPRGGKMVPTSMAYDPAKSKNWKQDVRLQVLAELQRNGAVPTTHDGPVVMDLFFYLPRPKSLPKRVKHHVKKPDRDNLAKGVKDALKGVLYRDDSQIMDGRICKQYGDPPRVVIGVRMLDQSEDIPQEAVHA